jgi:hypothetical protein
MNIPDDRMPEELVLAALDRAELHRARDAPGVPAWAILEHLDIPRRSKRARQVRSQLEALETAGSVERLRRHGIPMWALTPSGRQTVSHANAAGGVPELPESPQHRAWRNASTLAAQEIDRFRHSLRDTLAEANRLLEADPPTQSDTWFQLSDQLRQAAWRVGSASYCLYEWDEPHDDHADIDDHPAPGRRNTRTWDT